eukprot:758833-Hanusia_phi.AAC.2
MRASEPRWMQVACCPATAASFSLCQWLKPLSDCGNFCSYPLPVVSLREATQRSRKKVDDKCFRHRQEQAELLASER